MTNKNAYWGVSAVLVKHLSAMMGETFIEMDAKGRNSGLNEAAETNFVMALLYNKAGENWYPRLVLVQRDFLFSLMDKSEADFSFTLPPHAAELATLKTLAGIYNACEGNQLKMAEHGLVMANVSLPTEEN